MRGSLLCLACAWVVSGCASTTGGAVSRSFEREIVDAVPLQRLDVVVETSPVYRTEGALKPDAFPPPRLDARLAARFADPDQARALEAALSGWAEAQGFELGFLALPEQASLSDALERSQADGVLVVRGLAVDEFGVYDTKQEQRFIDLGSGDALPEVVGKPIPRTGRLIVGQAYLFDRSTGLRLWSRQIPDFPNEGKLLPGDPFFRYGFVQKRGVSELDASVKAKKAAAAFVSAILDGFPEPHEGDPEALAGIDRGALQRTAERDAFYDGSHWLLELGTGWSLASASIGAQLAQDQSDPDGGTVFEVPALGAGEILPSGTLRLLQPRATLILPGGLTMSGHFTYGVVPGDFRRTLVAPAVDPNADFDQFAELEVSGGQSLAFGFDLGYALWRSDRFLILPQLGLGYELLQFEDPNRLLQDATLDRPFLQGDLGVAWFPLEGSGLFLRPSVGFRVGWQVEDGSVFGALDLDGAVGFMF
ncbi:MAG: hypothetical protein AAF627_09220 [Myxococcota bacterium]